MKKHLFSALLLGAIASAFMFFVQSCNKDYEKLETRVTVLEGMVRQLEADLQAAKVTGATIVSSSQDADGNWTLVLSNGKTLVIEKGKGGGSEVTVEETDKAFIITVNKKAYTIPKTASVAVNSVVYVPEFEDGLVLLGNDGVTVKFLVTPALTDDQLDAAKAEIADAREVQTRSLAKSFKIEGFAMEDGLLNVDLKGLALEASTDYICSLKLTVDGTVISSNYFTVETTEDYYFSSEELETPEMIEGVQLTDLSGGFYRALIPSSAAKFLEGFNLKDYYKTVPEGQIEFVLAPSELQNQRVKEKYDYVNGSLAPNGDFKFATRPGTDFYDSEGKNGILIYMTANDIIKNKIYWQIDNPVPGMGLDQFLAKDGFSGGQHIEYGSEESVNAKWMIPAGEGTYDLAKALLTCTFPEGELLPEPIYLRHGNANADLQILQAASFTDGSGEEIVGNDGSKFILGDPLQPYLKYSRGIVFRTTQPSWASSIRENWSEEAKAACNGPANGEILGGWDGGGDIPGLMGWTINEKGLVTSAAYQGWAFRSGVGAYIEYDYGEQQLGPWHWFYMWFNRRVSPEGANDPDAR